MEYPRALAAQLDYNYLTKLLQKRNVSFLTRRGDAKETRKKVRMRRSSTIEGNGIDKEVGRLLRATRLRKGFSQPQLGDALGLTFQQVQKYEQGTNRIAVSRLFQIASVLNVPPKSLIPNSPAAEDGKDDVLSLLDGPDAIRMARAFKLVCPKWKLFWVETIEACANRWYPSCDE
jgi:transcriptional regulator with XRE-family HTH domain